MKVEVKNIKFHQGHDGMYGLNADIYIKGVKCMHVYDDAWGGDYMYTDYAYESKNSEKIETLIKEFEDYIKTLPPEKINIGGEIKEIPMTKDMLVNDLIEEYKKKKEKRRMKKYMMFSIVFGKPNASSYQVLKFKKPLADIPQAILQQQVDKVKREYCTNGIEILNTNLKELGITL